MAGRVYTQRPVAERFWEKVDKSGGPDACWNWTAARRFRNGYGMFGLWDRVSKIRQTVSAHRYAYELSFGPIPDDDSYHGIMVCHRCDNRMCVNPAHLFLGTAKDNATDMRNKNRGSHGEQHYSRTKPWRLARGEEHGNAKLSDADVLEIRRLGGLGLRQVDIASRFGVSQVLVGLVINKKAWKHIE